MRYNLIKNVHLRSANNDGLNLSFVRVRSIILAVAEAALSFSVLVVASSGLVRQSLLFLRTSDLAPSGFTLGKHNREIFPQRQSFFTFSDWPRAIPRVWCNSGEQLKNDDGSNQISSRIVAALLPLLSCRFCGAHQSNKIASPVTGSCFLSRQGRVSHKCRLNIEIEREAVPRRLPQVAMENLFLSVAEWKYFFQSTKIDL